MLSISVFFDIAKFADLRWKTADVSKTQGIFIYIGIHLIYIFSGSSLDKV